MQLPNTITLQIKRIFLPLLCRVFLLLGVCTFNSNAQTTPDPGLTGTYTVIKAEYNLGDLAYKPTSFPDSVEVRGSVHYPSALSLGPFPVLVFLHGRHETCYDSTDTTNTTLAWPCTGTFKPITSFEGYDYLAAKMASHGYIVISVSCNAINASDNSVTDYGMQARAELVQYHLDLWKKYNTTGAKPFDSLFIGKLDMKNIGTMGHSRGGEGVILNALYNKSLGSPYGIKAVLTLAPVDFLGQVLHGIPLLNIAPYCDGDVTDVEGVHFYDDARYPLAADEAPKHSILFMGANHNFFNTVWTPGSYIAGGSDDWEYYFSATDPHCGPDTIGNKRFDTTTQKAALVAYASAFFRLYVGHDTTFAPILNVDDIVPPASSKLHASDVYVSYHPGYTNRLDINRTDKRAADSINTLKGKVTGHGLLSPGICGGGYLMPDCDTNLYADQVPHDGSLATITGLAQMRIGWSDSTDYYQNEVPLAYEDLTTFRSLLFRAAVNFAISPPGKDLDFTVQLVDSAGKSSSQAVSTYSNALFYQPGIQPNDLPKKMFNTIKIPLSDFAGIDMSKVRYVRFRFNKSAKGAIMISDLALLNSPCGKFAAVYKDSLVSKYNVAFTDRSIGNNGDSLSWKWNFGDTLSGMDTSTLQNPVHAYSGAGSYNSCLYLKSYRKNGYTCSDTLCVKVTLLPDGVMPLAEDRITIAPNPAKDYLQINGAASTDILTLINVYGQVIFTTAIIKPTVYLPPNLATGIYYAKVTTGNGTMYKKLFINR